MSLTLKELNTKFYVPRYKHNGKYMIHEKEPGNSRMVHKYLCLINKKGGSFYVDGFKPTTQIDVLESQIREYVKNLPYDSEYYFPLYREGMFEEFIILDYLYSLGFKRGSYGMGRYFELKDKNIYGFKSSNFSISFSGLDTWDNSGKDKKGNITFNIPKTITIYLHTGSYSWIEVKVKRNVEDIKKGIDSLLKPLYLTDGVDNIKRAEMLHNNSKESCDIF